MLESRSSSEYGLTEFFYDARLKFKDVRFYQRLPTLLDENGQRVESFVGWMHFKFSEDLTQVIFSFQNLEILRISLVFFEGVSTVYQQSNGPYIAHYKTAGMKFLRFESTFEVRESKFEHLTEFSASSQSE